MCCAENETTVATSHSSMSADVQNETDTETGVLHRRDHMDETLLFRPEKAHEMKLNLNTNGPLPPSRSTSPL